MKIVMGEGNIYNKLIVMDNVSDFADKSDIFANFLTVSLKFNFTCIYVFHTIYPKRVKLQMILSQTKIFNIFPGSWQTSSVIKILSSKCNRYTTNTFCTETFASIAYTLKFQILAKNNAWQLT